MGAPRTSRLIHFLRVSVHSGNTNLDIGSLLAQVAKTPGGNICPVFRTFRSLFARLRRGILCRRSLATRGVMGTIRCWRSHVPTTPRLRQIVRESPPPVDATIRHSPPGVD